jgi:hypothetical protein
LPVVATGDDFRLLGNASGSVEGAVLALDYFDIDKGPQNLGLAIQGRVVARQVDVSERNEWDLSSTQWDLFWTQFSLQMGIPVTGIPYYPRWLETRGLRIQPLLTVKPESSPVRYYIPQGANTLLIYAPHADDDGGLRWELLSWSEG